MTKRKTEEEEFDLTRLLASERLSQDVEQMMNSSFWLDQLKCRKASGLGHVYYCTLNKKRTLYT